MYRGAVRAYRACLAPPLTMQDLLIPRKQLGEDLLQLGICSIPDGAHVA